MNTEIALILGVAVLWPLTTYWAFCLGRKRGIDIGWLERYFQQISNERTQRHNKRDSLGRFAPKED